MSARPFFPHEVDDPDLDWLVSNFLQDRPNFIPIEAGQLPIILMPYHSQNHSKRDGGMPNPLRGRKASTEITDELSSGEE